MTKVGRNDPCPCGSGKKFKKCCETKQAEEKLTDLYGESWKESDLELFKGFDAKGIISEYLKAFNEQKYGLMYDLHTEDSPLKKKRPSKLQFIGEQKTRFDPKYFTLLKSEILNAREDGSEANVIHRADIKLDEDDEISLLENYVMVKKAERWQIIGTQQRIFGDPEKDGGGEKDKKKWRELLDWKERFESRSKREPTSKIPAEVTFDFFKGLPVT
jgi:uncharacterized protein YchJ